MADTSKFIVSIPAGLAQSWNKARIYGDSDDVIAGRNYRLAITAIKNEILSSQEKAIRVSPAVTITLVAGNPYRSTITELRTL